MISYIFKIEDVIEIDLKGAKIAQEEMLTKIFLSYCQFSGGSQIFFEAFAYLNFFTYLVILRKSVADTTINFEKERIKCFAFSLTLSIVILLFFGIKIKIGVNSTVECGIMFRENSPYIELLRNWQIILVPFIAWKCIGLTKNLPGFVLLGSFTYYKNQISLYISIFSIRMCASLLIQIASIANE